MTELEVALPSLDLLVGLLDEHDTLIAGKKIGYFCLLGVLRGSARELAHDAKDLGATACKIFGILYVSYGYGIFIDEI